MHIFKKLCFHKWNIKKIIFHCQVFIFHCQGTELQVKHYTTKCKICFSSINFAYNKKKIQIFGVKMTFVSSHAVKKCIFHLWLCHSWNIHFFTSFDDIKVIVTPKIWISSLYLFLGQEGGNSRPGMRYVCATGSWCVCSWNYGCSSW